jgi:hypothetical protein
MKKIIYGSLFLALIGAAFIGCKKTELGKEVENKENVLIENQQRSVNSYGVSTDKTMLVFKTVEDYEAFLASNENSVDPVDQTDLKNANFIRYIQRLNYVKFKKSDAYISLLNLGKSEDYPDIIL